MADRHFPVRPNLDQLKHQAKDLLRDIPMGPCETQSGAGLGFLLDLGSG